MDHPFFGYNEPTHEERIATLRFMEPERLGPFLRDKAKEGKVGWIQAGLDAGCFDFADEYAYTGQVTIAYRGVAAQIDLLKSQETSHYLTTDPRDGDGPSDVLAAKVKRLNARAPCIDLFSQTVERLLDQYQAFQYQAFHTSTIDKADRVAVVKRDHAVDRIETTMSWLLGAACMVGNVEEAMRIAQAFPKAVNRPIQAVTFNLPLSLSLAAPDNVEIENVTPYLVAMAYSRTDCMEMLKTHGANLEVILTANDKEMDVFGMLEHFTPECHPSTMGVAMKHRLDETDDRTFVLRHFKPHALEAISRNPPIEVPLLSPYLPAMSQAGLYELWATEAALLAVAHGRPWLLETLKDKVDWEKIDLLDFTQSPVFQCLRSAGVPLKDGNGYEDALLAFMGAAKEAGHGSRAFATQHMENTDSMSMLKGQKVPQPVFDLVCAGFNRALVQYLENGFDPRLSVDGEKNFIAQAEFINANEAAGIMRSFLARQNIMGLLENMDEREPTQDPEAKRATGTAP